MRAVAPRSGQMRMRRGRAPGPDGDGERARRLVERGRGELREPVRVQGASEIDRFPLRAHERQREVVLARRRRSRSRRSVSAGDAMGAPYPGAPLDLSTGPERTDPAHGIVAADGDSIKA